MASSTSTRSTRPAAVAGSFYPAEPAVLLETVQDFLFKAPALAELPRAIIVPHAGYVYSGAVAASAYASLLRLRTQIRRVIILGPAHRQAVQGIAAPSVDFFATPLGDLPVDRQALRRLKKFPQVLFADAPHRLEHSLEVQLPFLQAILSDFAILPLLVGQASAEDVYQIIDEFWREAETFYVISSDLSHYLDYATAQRLDARTARAIENLDHASIGFDQACGRTPIAGMLLAAQRKGLRLKTLDSRNSGDTAGSRDRVVGYGAWLAVAAEENLLACRERLLALARRSIEHGLQHGHHPIAVDLGNEPELLQQPGACFVSLHLHGNLRGCLGSLEATRPLAEDLAANACAAAFRDPRFPPLRESEYRAVELAISVLETPVEMAFASEQDLLEQLRPGIDGLILRDNDRRGTFLPLVWESLPEPRQFLRQLKVKAGLPPDYWSDSLRVWRYATTLVK